MEMQSCNHCGASWKLNTIVNRCPFCDAILNEEKNPIGSINDAFSTIIKYHGAEVFLQGNRFLGLLGDYAPFLSQERKLVRIAVDSGAYKALYESEDSKREATYNRYVKILTDSFFLDEYWARIVLLWCYNAISPSKLNITNINPPLNNQSRRINTSIDATSSDITMKSDDSSDLWMELYEYSIDRTEVDGKSLGRIVPQKTDGQILLERLQREKQQRPSNISFQPKSGLNQKTIYGYQTSKKTDGQILLEKLHRERQQNTTVRPSHSLNGSRYSAKQITPRKTDGQILAEKLHREQQQRPSSLSSQIQYKQSIVARPIAPQKTDGQMLLEKLQREKYNDLGQSNQGQSSGTSVKESHPFWKRWHNIINGKNQQSDT